MYNAAAAKHKGTRRLRPLTPRRRIRTWIAAFIGCICVGTLIGETIVATRGGPLYRASFRLRAATADPLCNYFHCTATPRNQRVEPYVAGQAAIMRRPGFADTVRRHLVNAPSVEEVMTGA